MMTKVILWVYMCRCGCVLHSNHFRTIYIADMDNVIAVVLTTYKLSSCCVLNEREH